MTKVRFARRVYSLAEGRGRMFDARTYLDLRRDGWAAAAAIYYARRAFTGRSKPYLRAA